MQTETHYLGMVVTEEGGSLLADIDGPRQALGQRPRHAPGPRHAATAGRGRPPAQARPPAGAPPVAGTLPPPGGDRGRGRGLRRSRACPASRRRTESHLRQIAGRAAGRDGQADRRAGEGRDDVPGHRQVGRGVRLRSRSATRSFSASSPGRCTRAGTRSRTTRPTRWPRRWPPWRRAWPGGSRSRASNSIEGPP